MATDRAQDQGITASAPTSCGSSLLLRLDSRYLWLIALPLAVMIFGELFGDSLASTLSVDRNPVFLGSVKAPADLSLTGRQIMLEAAGRFKFLAGFLLLTAVSIGVLALSFLHLVNAIDRSSRVRMFIVFAASIVLSIIFFGIAKKFGWQRDTGALIGAAVFETGLSLSDTIGGPTGWSTTAKVIIQILTVPVAVAAAAVAIGTIGCLAQAPGADRPTEISRQRKISDLYLYLGATLLVVGILFEYAWTRWVGFYLPDDNESKTSIREAYFGVAGAWNMYKGVHYSILLASIYVPVAYLLMARTDTLVAAKRAADNDFDEEKFRKNYGLTSSMSDALRMMAVICAPFLTGAIGTLPNLFTK